MASGGRFALNCYNNWAKLHLRQPGNTPVIILSREGVTQGEPPLMVLYGIILAPLAEDLRDVYPTLLTSFYDNDAAFDG